MATERGRGQLTLTDINDAVAQAVAPNNPSDGALWYNTTEGQLYIYQSGRWVISNNIIVGGRNYLKNSDYRKHSPSGNITSKHPDVYADYYGGYNAGIANSTTSYHAHLDTTTFGFPVYEYNESDGNRNWKGASISVGDVVKESGDYMMSVDLNTTLIGSKIFGGFHYTKVGGTSSSFHAGQFLIETDTECVNKWKRYSGKLSLGSDADFSKPITLYIYAYGFSTNSILYVKKPKLEKGNINTEWSPSLEDTEGRIEDAERTLANMADDSVIDFAERKIIKNKLTDILGYVIADTATALPTSVVNDAGTNGKGSYYNGRKNALSAGYPTTSLPYTDLVTKYNALKTYLESYSVKPWDVAYIRKDTVTSVDKAVFRAKWLDYYTAELALANAVLEWLKKVSDDISIGGTNYASNGHFEYDITKSLWKDYYGGNLKEVVDISTEAPPFKKALHIKNTTNTNGGINSVVLWSGTSAQSLVDKDISIGFWMKYSGIVQGANSYNSGRFGELLVEGQKADGTKVTNFFRFDATGNITNGGFISGTDTTWKKYSGSCKLTLPTGTIKLTSITFRHLLDACVGEMWTTGLQIEVGNRLSDWSENPDDLRQRFTNVELAVTANSIINTISTTPAWLGKAELSDLSKSNNSQLLHKTRFTDVAGKWTLTSPWSIDNTKFFEGFGTLKADISGLTADASTSIYSETVPMVEGETFNASAYVFTDSLATDVENRGYNIIIEYFNSANSRITTHSTNAKPSVNGQWERLSNTFVAPTTTVKVRFRLSITRNGRLWVAKPMVARSTVLPAYSEHTDELATELSSQIAQTAGKVAIVVKEDNTIDGSSIASSIVATPNAISLVSANINLTGKVTFESLGTTMATSFETNGRVKAGNLSGTVPDANIASSGNWNTSKTNVDNMLSDMKVTPLEKNTLKNESEKIKKEYVQKIVQADIAGVDATAYKNAYNAIYNTAPRMDADVLASMSATYTFATSTARDLFRSQLVEYFNQIAILNKSITDNTTDLGMAMTGKMLYDDPLFRDGSNGMNYYNTTGVTNMTLNRIAGALDSPSASPNMLEVSVLTSNTSPGMGGFGFATTSKANAIFYVRFVAKIPTGYYLSHGSNSIGTSGNATRWITSNLGTGKWEEYIYKITCGSTGAFSTTAFFYLNPSAGTTVTYPLKWYVDSGTVYEHHSTDYSVKDSAKMISDMISDGKLSPTEKIQLRKEWGLVVAEYLTTKGIAQNYSVSTANYDTAYNTLNAQVPALISNILITSDAPSNLRTNFENYYKRRAELSSDVTDKTFSMQSTVGAVTTNPLLDDWNSTTPIGMGMWGNASFVKKETSLVRDGKYSLRFSAGMGTATDVGLSLNSGGFFKSNIANTKYFVVEISFYLVSGSTSGAGILFDWTGMSTSPTNRTTISLESTTNETIVAGRWYNGKRVVKRPHDVLTGYTNMAGYLMGNYAPISAKAEKDLVINRFIVREASAEEIKAYESDVIITDMASDLKITPQEKIQLKKEWTAIQKERPKMISTTSNAGMSNDTVVLDYTAYFNTLTSQVTPVLSNMLITNTVTSAFRTAFDNYYDGKASLMDAYNQKAYQAKKTTDSWTAPAKTTIDGSKIETETIISAKMLSIANGSSTEIKGGQIISSGSFTRLFEGSASDVNVTYVSTYESFNGAIKVGITSKKTPDGVERIPANGGRSLYYTDKNITSQRNIHAYSPNKNGARFIDFFAEESLDSNVVGGGMHIYSGQQMYMESESSMQLFTGSSMEINSYGSQTIRSYVSYIKLQPEYDNQGNNEFSFEVIDAATSIDTDGVLRYGSFVKTTQYGAGLRFSKSASENTIYVTNGLMEKGTGQLNAYKLSATVITEGGSRVVTNDRVASGNTTVTPRANDPTSKTISFGQTFSSVPNVVVCANTTEPGSIVKGVSVSDITTTSFKVWVNRTTTTDTGIQWIAMKN